MALALSGSAAAAFSYESFMSFSTLGSLFFPMSLVSCPDAAILRVYPVKTVSRSVIRNSLKASYSSPTIFMILCLLCFVSFSMSCDKNPLLLDIIEFVFYSTISVTSLSDMHF